LALRLALRQRTRKTLIMQVARCTHVQARIAMRSKIGTALMVAILLQGMSLFED